MSPSEELEKAQEALKEVQGELATAKQQVIKLLGERRQLQEQLTQLTTRIRNLVDKFEVQINTDPEKKD